MKRPPRNQQARRSDDAKRFARNSSRKGSENASGPLWLWGSHAVLAALQNPDRQVDRILATDNAVRRLGLNPSSDPRLDVTTAKALEHALPTGAVHQGVAVCAQPLEPIPLETLLEEMPSRIAVLDQVADPHNLGAIFRSAAAFDFAGLVLQTRHTPPITGIVAKSAAGAIETVREVRVVNIARSLDALRAEGYQVIGLAGETENTLAAVLAGETRVALVLGAEGDGLRPAVAKACDRVARIPIAPAMESLNVSNAAAIAFYETARSVSGTPQGT